MTEKKPTNTQKHEDQQRKKNLVEYDPEKAEDLVDVEEAADQANQVSSPNLDDPQHPKQGVPPNQENVPQGFTTGRGMQGGSANRRKR